MGAEMSIRNDRLHRIGVNISKALIKSFGSVVLAHVVLTAHPAAAQDRVKDFENAINHAQNSPKGTCQSIPYADYQDACVRKQAEVDRWCEGWSCKGMDPVELQKRIEALKVHRDAVRGEKENLERQMSSLTDDAAKREAEDKIEGLTDTIESAERQRDVIEKEVEEASRQISDQLYKGKACRDAREGVNEVYRNAKSRAASESDTAIAPLAKRLIAHWDDTEKGHEQEIVEIKLGIERCEKLLYDIGHIGSFSLIPALGPDAPGVGRPLSVLFATTCPTSQLGFADGSVHGALSLLVR
jgi:hypothetical protein